MNVAELALKIDALKQVKPLRRKSIPEPPDADDDLPRVVVKNSDIKSKSKTILQRHKEKRRSRRNDSLREYHRALYARNREKRRAKEREKYHKNREIITSRLRARYANDTEFRKKKLDDSLRQREKKKHETKNS